MLDNIHCFLESFVEPRKLSFNVGMVRFFIFFSDIFNIQSPTLGSSHNAALFDSCLCLQINNQFPGDGSGSVSSVCSSVLVGFPGGGGGGEFADPRGSGVPGGPGARCCGVGGVAVGGVSGDDGIGASSLPGCSGGKEDGAGTGGSGGAGCTAPGGKFGK